MGENVIHMSKGMMSLFPKILREARSSAAWFLEPAAVVHKPGIELSSHVYNIVTFLSNGNMAAQF